jgi:signal transduction histidine kinase
VDVKIPRLADAAIALALLTLAVSGLVMIESYDLGLGRSADVLGYALVVAMTAPLAWRQHFPRSVLWIVFVAWAAYASLSYVDGTGIFGVIVALYGAGLYLTRRQAIIHGVSATSLAVLWTVVGALTSPDVHPLSVLSVIIAFALPLEIGIIDNRRHLRLAELEVAHTRRERAHRAAAIDAVRAERARIARELHDVVAHEMTVMTLQAEGAKRIASSHDPAVGEALQTISESGRKGLTEMQRMIGVLRASELDAASAVVSELTEAGEEPPASISGFPYLEDLSPMPSLAGLPGLAAKVEASGLPVHLEITGNSHVPAGVELSAYRIVQESLTNAMKHAGPGAHADVTVKRREGKVTITVEDDGRGVISDVAKSHGGHGIAGMSERVAALGGTFEAGARRGGGYRVHATLPTSDDQVATPRRRPVDSTVRVPASKDRA